ncbi:hypothetical protein K8I31_00930, partial [bacterium]|nr:hypothetical protein [bacterium]
VKALSDTNTVAFLVKDTPKQGLILSPSEQDQFLFNATRGQTAIFVVMTPDLIFNPILGVFDPNGQVVQVVNDFVTTEPVILLQPETTGVYTIVIAAQTGADIGPYQIVVHDAPEITIGEVTSGDVRNPGDVAAFEMPLYKAEAYDFIATSVLDSEFTLILMDANGNVVEYTDPDLDDPTTTILPGFTPIQDGSLYMLVVGSEHEYTGLFDFEAKPLDDEEDDLWINVGETVTTVIGPVGDVDRFKVLVEEGQDYSLLTRGIWHYLDPSMRVLDADNQEVFFSDDAIYSRDSLLSRISFPGPGEYVVEISASANQPAVQAQTGVAAISFATGAPFDNAPPAMNDPAAVVTYTEDTVMVILPSGSVLDDTMPVNATVIIDKTQATGESVFE